MIVLAFKPRAQMTPEELEAVRARDRANEAERKRSARKHPIRAATQSVKRLAKSTLKRLTLLRPPLGEDERPRTRGDCIGAERPCPWVSCRHHLALEVHEATGAIKVVFPASAAEGHEDVDQGVLDVNLETMPETCSLDVADRDDATLEEVGRVLNITRERVRQIEARAMHRLGRKAIRELAAFAGDDALPVRRLTTAALQLVPRPTELVAKGEVVLDADLGDDLAVPDEDLER